MSEIPYNKPTLVGTEMNYLARCIENAHTSGNGEFTRLCQKILEESLGAPKALLTTSCTHALEMTALLLDIQSGDEVIVPAFTFPSTITAFVLRGAIPIFADIRPDTLNIDESRIEKLITTRTKAIVVMHYAGIACEMDKIMEIAEKHRLAVVEDNAHGLFGKYKGKYLGTFGVMAAQSFHETKNFSCGEGGALILNRDEYAARAEIIREKGTNRSSFFRGEIDRYSWVDIGSSYVLSDLLAAFLYANLEAAENIQMRRKEIWQRYEEGLRDWAQANDIGLPVVSADCEQAYHLFYLLLPSLEERSRLIEYLKNEGIHSIFHYQPLHLSKMGREFGGKEGDCPITETVSDCLLRLPFYNDFSLEEQNYVIEKVKTYMVKKSFPYACSLPARALNFLMLCSAFYQQCVYQL